VILDIKYFDKAPEQIQNVRMTSIYVNWTETAVPEIVIHSHLHIPQRNIDLSEIESFTVTND